MRPKLHGAAPAPVSATAALLAAPLLAAAFLGCAPPRPAPTPADQETPAVSQAEHDRRIDYIEIPVTEVGRAKRFYQDAFGWEFTDYGPDYTSFADGRLTGGLRLEPEVKPGGPLVVIYAADLAATEARVAKAGGRVTARHEFPGGRRFHFVDPSGNELAVWTDR